MNDRIVYPCGCANEPQPPSGVLRNVVRCPQHQGERRDPATLDERYFAELGLVRDGRPARSNHLEELAEALGSLSPAPPGSIALEVGCGASPYVPAILAAGYRYCGVDPSAWAIDWVRQTYGVEGLCARIEDALVPLPIPRLILAAHVLEHLGEAPRVIGGLARMLAPGGQLWLIVPDDSDPVNPDHTYFFDERTLGACVEDAGLEVVETAVRQYVEREKFLYARARKR